MYYVYSLCIALIIFIIISSFEKKQTITVKDLLTFIILYIIITFVVYYIYSAMNKTTTTIESTPSYIPETIQTGFNIVSS
tara:strand:- start:1598 stop:1837 length:240 start_codon:yes stop_codon:yes gene_type:complete